MRTLFTHLDRPYFKVRIRFLSSRHAARFIRVVMSRSSLQTKTLHSNPQELIELVRDAVSRNARIWITTSGTSMEPAIPGRSVVRLAPLGARSVRKGRVVFAAFPNGRVVVHRVLSVAGDSVVLRGDACADADPPLSKGDILAVVDRVLIDGRTYGGGGRTALRVVQRVRGVASRLVRKLA